MKKVVWGWTAFTSVFLWTVTNRGLWRPSISSASIGAEGSGQTGTFWIFVCLVPYVLGLFYLHGQQIHFRLQAVMLIGWHLAISMAALAIVLFAGSDALFAGQTWGWELPLIWVAAVSLVMTIMACGVVFQSQEWKNPPVAAPSRIRWKQLLACLLLTPVIAALFRLGDGYDGSGRLATGLAIVQWIGVLISFERPATRHKAP